ncbi:hypothetical protein OPQ81_000691 [Rhizoctonia solani]|nr:hypothetical protein OPQ81_000691 [Rhizoctonia solani]
MCEQGYKFCEALNIPPDQKIGSSHGWLDWFKERLGLCEVWFHGEAASAPIEQMGPEETCLQQILQNHLPSEVFNFDETAHLFRQSLKHVVGLESTLGLKEDKTQMSFGLCANADGSEKCPPFVHWVL